MNNTIRIIHPHKLMVLATVVKYKNITHAANALFMTQPAVTNIIRQLEQQFELKLLSHQGKKIILTDAGLSLASYWPQFESLYDTLHNDLLAQHSGQRGHIKLLMVSTGKYLVPPIINQFLRYYPGAKFQCQIAYRDEVVSGIIDGSHDFGVITNPPCHAQILAQKLNENQLVFVCRPSHKLAQKQQVRFSDIVNQSFVTREQSALITQALYQYFARYNKKPMVLYQIDSTEAIIESILTTESIALVPLLSINRPLQNGELVKLAIKIPHRYRSNYWYVIQREGRILNKISQYFLAYLLKQLT